MDYKVKIDKLTTAFMLPTEVADNYLKLAGAVQLKVLLYCYRHLSDGFDVDKVCNALSISKEDTEDALLFWCELGLMESDRKAPPTVNETKHIVPPKAVKPNRGEVNSRAFESPEIAFLLNEAQVKFGRMLKESERSVLVWLYDDLGLDAAVILMVIEYAIQAGKCNVGYIEKVGKSWAESGVDSISAAENKIVELGNERRCWNVMRSAFGLDMRAPSESETKMANKCVGEWKMPKELLKKAYNICVDQIGRYKASYIKTILTSWHKKGINTVKELENSSAEGLKQQNNKENSYATYDLSKLDDIINGD